MKFLSIISIVLVLFSCSSNIEQELRSTKVVGHRGSGSGVYDSIYLENTFISVKNGLEMLDGVEVDVQMSTDGTIWMFHDEEILNSCSSEQLGCLPLLSDEEIRNVRLCFANKTFEINTLEELFRFISTTEFANKTVSLDVKGWFTKECFSNRNAPKTYFKQFATSLILLVQKYQIEDRIIVETNYTTLFEYIKQQKPDIKCHLLAYNSFEKHLEKALDMNLDGLSYNLQDSLLIKEMIDKAHKNGLDVQLWSVYNQKQFDLAKQLQPDAIQLSNLNLLNPTVD